MILQKLEDITDRVALLTGKQYGENFIEKDLDESYLIVSNFKEDIELVSELCELILQLENYRYALRNIVSIFLINKKYNLLYAFITKIFTSHIGNIPYQSVLCEYSFKERYFDRFIEIVKYCEIDKTLYIPFILNIFETEGQEKAFILPAVEFLQNFFNENEEWVSENLNSYGPGFLSAILEFNTQKGIKFLLEDKEIEKNEHLIKRYKKEILMYLDKNVQIKDIKPYLDILFMFSNIEEVKCRLKNIYEATEDDEIKLKISYKLGLTESLSIKSEKQFLYSARRKIKVPNERALGVPFEKLSLVSKSGVKANNYIYSFIIYLFKEEKNLVNLSKLQILQTFFEKDSLTEFVLQMQKALFKLKDIKQAKWCIRMISILGEDVVLNYSLEMLYNLYKENRFKEADYLSQCLIYSKKHQIILILKRLLEEKVLTKDDIKHLISLMSLHIGITNDEIQDKLLTNELSREEIEKEKLRLFDSFLAARKYTPEFFDQVVLKNNILHRFAKKLIWGEYKFGRVYNAFSVTDEGKEYIVGKALEPDNDLYIMIIHSKDIDSRYDSLLNYIKDPLFDQFKTSNISSADFTTGSFAINRFCGTMVNFEKFLSAISDFKPNKREDEIIFDSLVCYKQNLKLVTILDLQIKNDIAMLGGISFYKDQDVVFDNGKIIPNKANAISLPAVPYRYFDFVIDNIRNAAINIR